MNRRYNYLFATASVFAIGVSSAWVMPAMAQDSNSVAPPVEEVVVSGTRIIRDGYSAPTPVTVVSPQMLATSSSGNISDYVNTMPSFFGSTTPVNSTTASSSAQAG